MIMQNIYFINAPLDTKVISIIPIATSVFSEWLNKQSVRIKNWINICKFSAKEATFCLIPNDNGNLEQVLLGIKDENDFWSFGCLPRELKEGYYKIYNENWSKEQLERALIAWGLGGYKFLNYKKIENSCDAKLQILTGLCDEKKITETVKTIFFVRDLINTPAEDMTPAKLAEFAKQLASNFSADFQEIIGDDLIRHNLPAVFTVGKGSANAPRLLDIHWGNVKNPKITLVGKGVCFDSGGLDLKPASGMSAMKKDMAGAAHVLGLAQLIMSFNLPINLRVIIPLVENLVSGSSYKPGDVIKTRKGLTVEVTNTDAEGRLILADALTYACEENPELIIDIATLTGAAKVALGAEIAALFTSSDNLAKEIIENCNAESEPVWQLPMYSPYKEMLKSSIADVANCGSGPYAGAVTAALFLQEFVDKNMEWAHFDIMGSNITNRPGRPIGGEAVCLRGLFKFIQQRFGKSCES